MGVFSNAGIFLFAKIFRINTSEAEKELFEYQSIGEFFVRKLKPNLRPIEKPPLHPCDSKITTYGSILNSTLIAAKGMEYSVNKLLNTDTNYYSYFITYYLSPKDYHRVHCPVDGIIKKATTIPGQLWPVNKISTKLIKNLFIINARLIIEIETKENKQVCVVLIGATNVGAIKAAFDNDLNINKPMVKNYNLNTNAGDELGMFNLGSTVVVLYSEQISGIKPGYVKCNSSLTDLNIPT